MTNNKRPIFVFGVTGRQGGSVARALLKAGWPVRALALNPAGAAALDLAIAGVELVQGSFEDTDVIRSAMEGVHGVFSVLPANLAAEDEVRYGSSIVSATSSPRLSPVDGRGAVRCFRTSALRALA